MSSHKKPRLETGSWSFMPGTRRQPSQLNHAETTNCRSGSSCRTRPPKPSPSRKPAPHAKGGIHVERGADPGAQRAGHPIADMETDPEATASQYRREAEHLRHAVELIEDARLRAQLLSIARQYDAAAGSIEQERRVRVLEKPAPPRCSHTNPPSLRKTPFSPTPAHPL